MLSLFLLYVLWQSVRQLVKSVEVRFRAWTKPSTYDLIEATAADLIRTKPELIVENALLRQQLIVLQREVKRPVFTPFDRILLVVLASRVSQWKKARLIIKPETLLKWHRQGFQLFWRHTSQSLARQPRLDEDTIALIKRMALNVLTTWSFVSCVHYTITPCLWWKRQDEVNSITGTGVFVLPAQAAGTFPEGTIMRLRQFTVKHGGVV